MKATDGRFPPDVLLQQDEALMDDLTTIAWIHNRLSGEIEREDGEESYEDGRR